MPESVSPDSAIEAAARASDMHPVRRMTARKLSFIDIPSDGTPVADLHLETDGGVLDVISTILSIGDYARLRQTGEIIPLFGRDCAAISLGDLIAAEEALGREKDLLAAKELRAIAAKRRSSH